MKELSLFTGAGGGLLGTKLLGWEPIGYVEWNEYCQKILRQRILDGFLPNAPIFGDVRAFISEGYAEAYQGLVDVITGGFPCQPFSIAGKQLGESDERNMWNETISCIRIIRPRYAFLENVPGLVTSGYFGTILSDLHESGYDCRWRILSASEMGAPHKRDRLWIYCANTSIEGSGQVSIQPGRSQQANANTEWLCGDVSNSNRSRLDRQNEIHPDNDKERNNPSSEQSRQAESSEFISGSEDVPNANGRRCQERDPEERFVSELDADYRIPNAYSQRLEERNATPIANQSRQSTGRATEGRGVTWWEAEPDVGRVVDGVGFRVDRLRAIGNGQVPAVVATAWKLLSQNLP